jgi:hypothetical protein
MFSSKFTCQLLKVKAPPTFIYYWRQGVGLLTALTEAVAGRTNIPVIFSCG